METYVAITFISPGKSKSSLDGANWEMVKLQHDGPEVVFVRSLQTEKAPLMLMIHGWRSSSLSMAGRADLYLKLGYHVAIMELPGHGSAEGVKKWNAGVPVRNLIHLFKNLDSVCNTSLISKIYFHGHSMGGFVSLRFSKEISKMTHSNLVEGYILEENTVIRFSRIPVFGESIDDIKGIAIRSELLMAASRDEWNREISEFTKPVKTVKGDSSVDSALDMFLTQRQQVAVVEDEFGGTAGIVTMEDVLETLLGEEIVDELDEVDDMRELAREQADTSEDE